MSTGILLRLTCSTMEVSFKDEDPVVSGCLSAWATASSAGHSSKILVRSGLMPAPAPSLNLLSAPVTSPESPRRSEAITRRSTSVVRLAAGNARGLGLASLGSECLQQIVTAPELLFSSSAIWLKQARDRRVALVTAQDGSQTVWCCKESSTTNLWVRFLSLISSLRAWNAFRQGLLLREIGIPTPQPLAVVGVTRCGIQYEYLLTEAVDDATSLQRWLTDQAYLGGQADLAQRRQNLARQLGHELQRLHRHRFDHRDLKATNILVSHDDCPWLIDLDGIRRWPLLLRHRRVQNLARLWVGVSLTGNRHSTDALRFLFAYLSPTDRRHWKDWWRDVNRRAERKLKQLKRKNKDS